MTNFVNDAESVIKNLEKDHNGCIKLTTSQLRKFLSAVNTVANKVQVCKEEDFENLVNEIQYLRVKLAYQAGRYLPVKDLAIKANLDERIKSIDKKSAFEEFSRFIEAIVAYHKFYGGKD